jgi:hypothetical protein
MDNNELIALLTKSKDEVIAAKNEIINTLKAHIKILEESIATFEKNKQ